MLDANVGESDAKDVEIDANPERSDAKDGGLDACLVVPDARACDRVSKQAPRPIGGLRPP